MTLRQKENKDNSKRDQKATAAMAVAAATAASGIGVNVAGGAITASGIGVDVAGGAITASKKVCSTMKTILIALVSLFLFVSTSAVAQMYGDAESLVAAMDNQPEPESLSSELTMVITSSGGQSLSRSIQSWAKGDNRLIKFTGPADIEGSGLLTLDDGAFEVKATAGNTHLGG